MAKLPFKTCLILTAIACGCAIAAESATSSDTELWSLRRPVRSALPNVNDSAWPRTEIDLFVLSRLEAAGLRPAADADRPTLVRRLYFDLTGLPPTPAELRDFLADASPDAYEKLVDRLLASPAFGQRWGRHWLDVARYAESVGGGRTRVFEQAWRYRDYVIDSFNADLPYDRFICEQIAGDLLPYESPRQGQAQLIATGFLQLGAKNLDEQNKEQLTLDVVDEQLDVIGQAMLGLTIGCARCHDHKFDPISARDYYAMAGIFTSTESLRHANVSGYLELPVPVDPQWQQRLDEHQATLAAQEARLRGASEQVKGLSKKFASIESQLPGKLVDDEQAHRTGQWQISSTAGPFHGASYRYSASTDAQAKFEAVLDDDGPHEVWVSHAPHPNRASNTLITVHHAGGAAEHRVNQREPGPIGGRFVSLGIYEFAAGKPAAVVVSRHGANGTVIADAVRFIPVAPAATADDLPGTFETGELARLGIELRAAEREVAEQSRLLGLLRKEAPPAPPLAMAVRDSPEPTDTPIRLRGVPESHGELVPRGFLSAVAIAGPPMIAPGRSGRLELAQWLTAPDHPLTARVMVNRIWMHLLGEGLVRSVDNFGARGQSPSHPQLLDHLALSLVEDGWSIKATVRRIVLSRVYRLSTSHNPAAYAVDPENRLLWRAHRKRLSAEALRDAMLAVSGDLDQAMGGRTIEGKVETEFEYHIKHASRRRGVYLPVFRNSLPGLFEVFDFAEPNLVCGRRSTSTLSTQALFMLNSQEVLDRAHAAATRLLSSGPIDPGAGVERAYMAVLGRAPGPEERSLAVRFLQDELQAGADPVQAWSGLYQALFGCIDFRYLN